MHWRDGVGEGIGSASWAHPWPPLRHTPKVHAPTFSTLAIAGEAWV